MNGSGRYASRYHHHHHLVQYCQSVNASRRESLRCWLLQDGLVKYQNCCLNILYAPMMINAAISHCNLNRPEVSFDLSELFTDDPKARGHFLSIDGISVHGISVRCRRVLNVQAVFRCHFVEGISCK